MSNSIPYGGSVTINCGFVAVQQPRHNIRFCAIAAQIIRCPPHEPRVAGLDDRILGQGRNVLGAVIQFGSARKSSISRSSKPVRLKSKSRLPQFLQLRAQQFEVPVSLLVAAVVHQPVRS